jgi:hypothetical protein
MKSFILKAIILILSVLVSCLVIYLHDPFRNSSNPTHYLLAIVDKHSRLERIPPPRIILAGGSNLAFGIDSQEIEKQIGLPVINMGLHAGLGIRFILNDLEPFVGQGDVVILCPEYNAAAGTTEVKNRMVEVYPPAAKAMYQGLYEKAQWELEQSQDLLALRFERLQETFTRIAGRFFGHKSQAQAAAKSKDIYRRSAFSDRGDMVAHLKEQFVGELGDRGKLQEADCGQEIKALNNFARSVRSRGAVAYFCYPSYCQSEFQRNKQAIRYYQRQFENRLEMKIINTPEACAYPDSLFFDTVYHLTDAGRKRRTDDLVMIFKSSILPGLVKARHDKVFGASELGSGAKELQESF